MQDHLDNTYGNSFQPMEPYMLYGDRSEAAYRQSTSQGHMARDLEYLQGLYPGQMKVLQEYVITACDRLDYRNSPIYDEYPDRLMIHQVCDSVCRQIEEDGILRGSELYEPEQQPGDDTESLNSTESIDGTQMEEMISPDSCQTELNSQEFEWLQYQEMQMQNRRPQGPPPWGPPPGPRPPWGPPHWGPPPGPRPPWGPPHWGPPPGPRPPWGPPGHNRPGNWLNNIVNVLLLNEMHRRRCRTGRCF